MNSTPGNISKLTKQPEAATDLRVIIVGKTLLDSALRRDPRLELARVRTPLEAVGELADPIDGSSPRMAAVIVAQGAGPDGERDGDTAADFVAALRLIDPHTPVLIEAPGTSGQPAEPYDATVRSEASAAEVREVIARIGMARHGWIGGTPVAESDPAVSMAREAAAAPRAAPAASAAPSVGARTTPPRDSQAPAQVEHVHRAPAGSVQNPPQSARPATAATTFSPPHTRPVLNIEPVMSPASGGSIAGAGAATDIATASVISDAVMVRALLAGRDPLLPALELIRARSGAPDVSFVGSEGADGKPLAPPAGAVPVRIGDRALGWLRSAVASAEQLRPQAEWMGLWLGLIEQQASLRHMAMVDDLTGAYNRRYFDRYMQQAIEHAQRARLVITLMVFDIDDFKSFNDRFGHAAGDQILRESVLLLRSVIRPTDRVCRIGGDEFAVIFYDASGPRDPGSKMPDDPMTIARRFQQQIREHRFPKLGDCAPGTLTISAGLAAFPWDGRNAAELLERADQLALESKRAGKNALRVGPGAG